MKLVIEQGGVKREILGPFRMCLSRADAAALQRCVENMAKSGTYGWVDIYDPPDMLEVEGSPRPWIE